MSVCQSFSFILHRSSSEATFYHTLPGPPFSQWTALSDGLYDVLLFFITVVRRLRNARTHINTGFFFLQNKTTPHWFMVK